MSKILIENYRGFDIEFETSNEKFQCVCTEDDTKESNSFAAVKYDAAIPIFFENK